MVSLLVVAVGRPAQAEDANPLLHIGWQQAYIEMMNEGNCADALRILDAAQKAGFHAAYGAEASLAENGNCVEKNMERAVKLHTVAAPFSPHSEIRLWAIYEYGLVGEPDPKQAQYWAERAARHYIDKTRDEAESAFAEDAGLQTPTATVKQALDQLFAIKSEGPVNITYQALKLQPGGGFDGDAQASCEWFKYAAENGDSSAYIPYAQMHLYEIGIEKNVTQALIALHTGIERKVDLAYKIAISEIILGENLRQDWPTAYKLALIAEHNGSDVEGLKLIVRKHLPVWEQKNIEADVKHRPEKVPLLEEAADHLVVMQPPCWARVSN